MYKLLLKTMLAGVLIGAQAAGAQSPGPISSRPELCHVVIAVDISGNMESSDEPTSDAAAGRQTLRDQGQLVFLQLLPYLQSDLYVGVAHFSDRVRYTLPREETGPLLPWGQTFLTESACRNMVKPTEFQGTFRADIGASMTWAVDRIEAARRAYGRGPGKLILLTNGDPRGSARELDRGGGPLLNLAKRLVSQKIQMYPVLISGAAFRASEARSGLSADEVSAEDLMHSVASMTGGRAYRLRRDFGFVDILMDIFDLGMQAGTQNPVSAAVSRYDWAIVAVGDPVKSATVEPAGGADKKPQSLTFESGLEATSGIRATVVSSPGYQATVLRRPQAGDFVERFWEGTWTLGPAQTKSQPGVRIYRIPEFVMQLELEPELPWWRHEQVRAKAHLLERHRKAPDARAAASSAGGQGLSILMRAGAANETNSVRVSEGRWSVPGRLYETELFTIGAPGLYKLASELQHAIGDANVPILRCAGDVYVHAECVNIKVVNAATDEVLQEVPPTAAAAVSISLPGGQDVYFRVSGTGEFKVEPQSGTLYLEPLSQAQWPLRKDEQGNLTTGPIPLVEREEQLAGWAELDVRTHVGVRHFRFPRFDLAYPPAPMQVECTFTDPREALWVGEYHRQPLVISAFPVFDRFRDATVRRFPGTLAQTRIRTVDVSSGTTQVTGPESRVLNLPQAGGYKGRTITATYFVESAIPVPSADRFEIDLGPALENLQGNVKTYGVVDPVAEGLFTWTIAPPGQSRTRSPAGPETLFCGEPVQFHAQWRADQNISAVRFEFAHADANEPIFVDVPVKAGTQKADLEQVVAGLLAGQSLPAYVHVTMQPSGADRALQIKLRGGQFRTEDRRVLLEDLKAGEGAPTDIPAYAWEPVEIPLRAVFSGYTATDPRHNAAIEQFKKSCVVTVTSRTGDAKNVSDTIEWTSVTPAEGPSKRCELAGRAVYMPDAPGRVAVEVTAEMPVPQGTEPAARRAYAQVLARTPRLSVTIHKLTPAGEEPVFDSRKWSAGEGGISALLTRFSARLRVDVRGNDWAATGQTQPWRTMVRLLRRPAADAQWVSEFSDTGEVTLNTPFTREVQTGGNGEYVLEVTGYDSQSGRRTAFFMTPPIALVQPHEIKAALTPPAWLTSRVRQWPFEYQVTLHQEAVDVGQAQALAFQFQLPGQSEAWMEGTTSAIPSETSDARQLLVKGPRFLPVAQGLRDGVVRFKLSSQGIDLLRWECPDIRVIPPVLERLTLSRRNNGDPIDVAGAQVALDGSADLWVRPQFRVAPELEGQWTPLESTVYLWRHGSAESTGGQIDVRALANLQESQGTGAVRPSIEAFRIEDAASSNAVRVIPRRAGLRLFGWPRRPTGERYSVVASVIYRPRETAAPSGTTAALPADRMIAEWSDVYAVQLNTPWVVPLLWWPIVAILLVGLIMAALRLFVPSPSRLALDMRLQENVAVVEPVRLDNPVLVDLQETSLTRDVQLYTRYLRSRWSRGTLGRGMAFIVAPIQVLLRRALYPRRWAWTAVIPRTRGDARSARTGLLCVWTGLRARDGRVWSCQDGSLSLPQEGQVKAVHLDLPYRVDNVNRTMRVTVRIQRTTSSRQ